MHLLFALFVKFFAESGLHVGFPAGNRRFKPRVRVLHFLHRPRKVAAHVLDQRLRHGFAAQLAAAYHLHDILLGDGFAAVSFQTFGDISDCINTALNQRIYVFHCNFVGQVHAADICCNGGFRG